MSDPVILKTGPASAEATDFAAELDAAVAEQRAGQAHGAVGVLLRRRFPELRADAFAHSARGDRIAERLARHVEDIIKELYERAPKTDQPLALCAVGGFGRRRLAPFSDVDLLALHGGKVDAEQRAALDFMLYALWDSGAKVGHNVHTPKSAAQFAQTDMIARTAYLDARFLCGSRELFEEFENAYDKLRRRTRKQFTAAKLKEQDERQSRADETRYLVEPDIKEGKGGLRDIQTIHWIYKYVYGAAIGDSSSIEKILSASERRALAKAERFLWSVRVHMHDIRGRADEKLSFDIQPRIAERLGYGGRANMTAAERLMKHYFINAVEVGRLTRVLCAKLEEEQAKRLPNFSSAPPKALQSDEAPGKPNLRIRNGRLDFENAAKARRNPRDFFRLFRGFSKKPSIDFHPDALAIVSEETPSVTSAVRNDPIVAKLFEGVLTRSADPTRVLRIMTETGLLGKYIPAFGSLVGRIHYGLYRRYTLDEHVLRSINILSQIRRGELAEDHPISTRIVKETKTPLLYFLGVLLHESIWSVKDKSPALCERRVERIGRRLGLDDDDAKLVGWAAARHLLMVRTAERRNLTEAKAISTFAEQTGSKARLDLLLVLSVCYLRIVGHYSWDATVRRNLQDLYDGSVLWLEQGDEALRERLAERAAAAKKRAETGLADWAEGDREAFLGRLTEATLSAVDPEMIVRFAHLARAAEQDGAPAAVTVTPIDNGLEAIVFADDRRGLLADLAGAVAACGLSVRSLHALTTKDEKALDIFDVQSADGAQINDQGQARRLHGALLSAARASPASPPRWTRRLGDRRSIFHVTPKVRVDLEASEDAAIVEAEGLDRPGLLYDLAGALRDLETQIASAHIATYGERAVDAFYLKDRAGRKITDAEALARIEQRLIDVLSAGSGA